jgi:hypothetical protein
MAWKPVYATLDEMREWLRINDPDDTADDALLQLKLSAASRAVDGTCRRQFGKADTAVTRSYELRWSRTRNAYVAEIDDLMDTTDLVFTVDGVTLTADHYRLMPRNAIADGEPYTYVVVSATPTGEGVLDGLALWGWTPVSEDEPYPAPIREATMLQASRLNIRRDSPFGVAGSPSEGSELRLLARLDPDVAPLVVDYVSTGWVAR